jgi:hypothetical protein
VTAADDQLAAIGMLAKVLERHGIRYWLFGGWAVDFWVGAVTRDHDDVDVAAWRADAGRLIPALQQAGWQHVQEPDEPGARFQLGTVLLEITFVVPDGDRVLVLLPTGPAVWSEQPFGDERRGLGGVTSRTVPLELLRAGKATPRDDPADAAKDRADHEALSRVAG